MASPMKAKEKLNQNQTRKSQSHAIEVHASAIVAFGLVMTLTFDL